jgi:hypothetical protein
VKGFEEIKNPKYNSKENIVESYVVSAQNWVGFYKIKNNIAVDLKIEIDNGEYFDRDYENAIKKSRPKNKKLPTTHANRQCWQLSKINIIFLSLFALAERTQFQSPQPKSSRER